MCFGDNETTTTVTQNIPALSPEEQTARQLALQSLQFRQALMPFLLQEVGLEVAPTTPSAPAEAAGATSAPSAPFQLQRLPPGQNQSLMQALTGTSLGGANQSAMMMLQRLQAGQSLLPGLLQSVQGSMRG